MKRKRLRVGDWVSYEDMNGHRRIIGEIMKVNKNKEGLITAYSVRFGSRILVLDENQIRKVLNSNVMGL